MNKYDFGEQIGEGNYSIVRIAVNKITRSRFAAKEIDKSKLNLRQRQRIYSEIEILLVCKHPNITNLVEHFETKDKIYIILELKRGGDLFDMIVYRGYFPEDEVRSMIKQVGAALVYLHKKGIVHRDLKPENMLFEENHPNSRLCLADFGFAKFVTDEDWIASPCGTVQYVAPEIANAETYKKSVDMWSLGVVMYTLLCGFPPFFSEDDDVLLELIAAGEYSFPSPWWDNISQGAQEVVRGLLQKDPSQRFSAEQLLSHEWFADSLPIPTKEKQSKESEGKEGKSEKLELRQSQSHVPSAAALTVLNRAVALQRGPLLRAASEASLWQRRAQPHWKLRSMG